MTGPPQPASGVTLLELLVALVLVGLLASLAAPRLQRSLESTRIRSALNQVTAQIYRARMIAVESGRPAYLVLRSSAGCIAGLQVTAEDATDSHPPTMPSLDLADLCLRHSGDSILIFNGRGMLRPPARSIFAADPGNPDSVLVSIAGRVRRSY